MLNTLATKPVNTHISGILETFFEIQQNARQNAFHACMREYICV
jgi:hypothetical protein